MKYVDVKIGDVFATREGSFRPRLVKIVVARVTKTQFMDNHERAYRKKDGRMVGSDYRQAELWGPDHDAQLVEQENSDKRAELMRNIESFFTYNRNTNKLTDSEIETVRKIVAEARGRP